MGLSPGSRLGPYEIIAPAGAGGMGEVYRARDSRLGRTVAIKVLPAEFASDPDRRARFEREARAISALAHPHVCALYDVGHESGIDFLVMEHLEGDTLAQRLGRGAIPLDQALEYAVQIASGLHEAHRLGIVHRDLKPSNVMLTRTGARLLDFGIARLRPAATHPLKAARDASTHMLTAEHTFVGTVPYVSPEQIAGGEVDTRADIFSFGVVLFELVTGRVPFDGQTTAGVMAAIMEKEAPALAVHVPSVPRALERLVQHCLIKSPELRWQSARDLELDLRAIRASLGAAERAVARRRRPLAATVAAGALLAAAGVLAGVAIAKRGRPPADTPARVVQFSVPLAAGESIHEHSSSSIALSTDGGRIAYSVNRPDGRGIYVRALDAPLPRWIAGTDRATSPFFSPDGQWIAFESGGSLKKVQVDGGTPVRLCDAPYFSGGSWGGDRIVFVPSFTAGLFEVPAAGGRPSRLTTLDSKQGERAHLWPQLLPDGRVLFTIWTGGAYDESRLALWSPATGKYAPIFEGGFHGRYSSGRLFFARGNRLLAVPFDIDRGVATGAVDQIVDGVGGDGGSGVALFSLSADGTLAYVPGTPRPLPRSLVSVDPKGLAQTISDVPRAFSAVRVSPDGRRLAVWTEETYAAVWLKDMARDPLTRLTFSGDDHGPVWSPNGRWIAFESGRASTHHVFVRAVDGSGEDRQITTGENHHYLNDWSPDGRSLIYDEFHPETGSDLWIVNAEGPPQYRKYRATPFAEKQATFSPDGRWIAYVANDSDRNEVYVQAVSGAEERTQISSGGGDEPAWSRSGDRLFYRHGSRMMAVPVTTGERFTAGRPSVLFEGMYHYSITPNRAYDVTPDGRFIMVSLPDPASSPRQVNVILNRFR